MLFSVNFFYVDCRRQNLIFRVRCSKGTYIRSLCADFGKALGRYSLRISSFFYLFIYFPKNVKYPTTTTFVAFSFCI